MRGRHRQAAVRKGAAGRCNRGRRGRQRPARADIQARVVDLLRFVQLEGLGVRFPAQLSGGQRQSVAIGRAIAFGTKLVIMDEPTAALSDHECAELFRAIRQLCQRGVTVVYTTHKMDEVFHMGIADRFINWVFEPAFPTRDDQL